MYQQTVRKFNSISFAIITSLCVLLPLFFLPATLSGLGATKAVLLYVAVFMAFSLWLVSQFLEGTLRFSKHHSFALLGGWVAFSLVSALTSQNTGVSLWGRGFAVDSFATVLVVGLLTFLVASFARDQRRLVQLFLAAFAGSVLTVFLQIALYVTRGTQFVATYLPHVSSQGTLVGSWVDFAYFVTFTFLFGLLMYEVLMPKGFFKALSLIAMVLSLIALIFLNFNAAWVVTIVAALLVFVYKSSVERSLSRFFRQNEDIEEDPSTQRFPLMSFIALLVGLFFFLSSGSIGVSLSQRAGVSFTDIRPSFSTTTQVMRSALAKDPVFGAGAGRYADVWSLYHPSAINQTMFWNTPFDTGFSFLQSLFTTNGILPIVFLIAALVVAVVHGFKLFSYKFPDRFSRFIAVTSLIMLAAFICLIVFASPGIVLIVFGFMYLGLLLGVSTLVGKTKLASVRYLEDPRTSFFAILVIVVAAMAGFSAVYFSGNRLASIIYYNRALAATDAGTAQSRLDKAIALSQNDIYWRTRTALFVNQFNTAARQQNPDKNQLQNFFSGAEQSAQAAVAWDPGSASNWLSLSQVYQLVAGSQNEQGYSSAKSAADEAQKRGPNNPVFLLNQAQLALTKQDTSTANMYIGQAIALKADYLDAYVLKAQMGQTAGDTGAAVREMVAYTTAAPYDHSGFLLLGQAYLQAKQYDNAITAYGRARDLAPNDPSAYLEYVNALTEAGRKQDAVAALRNFKTRFPQVNGVDEQIQKIQNAVPATVPSEVPTAPVENQ